MAIPHSPTTMNDFLHLCAERRSVRRYSSELPSAADLQYIQDCVRLAPSAVNFQPVLFRYLSTPEQLRRLWPCYNREWFQTAPACFIVYRNTQTEWVRRFDGKPHGDIDAAIAIEHLCLAAAERGLGTCWVCNYDPEALQAAFPAPEGHTAVALIPIGRPADEPREKQRKALGDLFF
mgnify:FL=1